ncbi:MAG: recombinase zinc beta ribbon domain-containing protein [Patescibacteria group bacterium]
MICGLCESGISAAEKWKRQKNGNAHRYVYYGCTKAKDKHCKCGYIEEKELIKQFEKLLENIDISEIEIREKIKVDIDKFMKLQKFMLGTKEKINIDTIDIRGYTKYVLKEGTDVEKRELLGCLKSKIKLKNKIISIN